MAGRFRLALVRLAEGPKGHPRQIRVDHPGEERGSVKSTA